MQKHTRVNKPSTDVFWDFSENEIIEILYDYLEKQKESMIDGDLSIGLYPSDQGQNGESHVTLFIRGD